jgi:hypothetical protein
MCKSYHEVKAAKDQIVQHKNEKNYIYKSSVTEWDCKLNWKQEGQGHGSYLVSSLLLALVSSTRSLSLKFLPVPTFCVCKQSKTKECR